MSSVAAAMLWAAGCTSAPSPPAPSPHAPSPHAAVPIELDGWVRVSLPDSLHPSTIALVDRTLVVGGFVGSGTARSPAMASSPAGRPHFETTIVQPRTPYGKSADLISVAGVGSVVIALGAAHGGAHANFRWTVWSGTTDKIIDRPQSFDAFGGEASGGLLDVAWDHSGPLIVGTWQGSHGLDGRVWRESDGRWSRQTRIPTLISTAERDVAPRAAETQNDATVISGSVIDLTGGVHQSAAIWRGSGAQWPMTVLPDPGRRSEAWSTGCAEVCATVGARDGLAAIWVGRQRQSLPDVPVGDDDNGVVLVSGDHLLVALSSAGQARLLIRVGKAWRAYTGPTGVVRSAELVGSTLYLVTADNNGTLWTRDLADVV